jgi:hypothetical protein
MAEQLFYIGTVGPFFIADTDPLYENPGQVVTKKDIVNFSNTVTSELGEPHASTAGVSNTASRGDHTHGTPAGLDFLSHCSVSVDGLPLWDGLPWPGGTPSSDALTYDDNTEITYDDGGNVTGG